MQLGNVTQIKSVISMKPPSAIMETETSDKGSDLKVGQVNADNTEEESGWESEIKLDETHFTLDQVSKIRQMLREECSSFSRDENDLGCAPDLELDIQLKDDTPVKQPYRSVPPPLHQEVKDYI